ncbi:xenobiotic acyltransferase family protein [Pedobacter sp. PWIIR3]
MINNSILYDDILVDKNSKIKATTLRGNNRIGANVVLNNSELGSFSYVGENSRVNNTRIGKYCSIGPDFKVGLGIHPIAFLSTSPIFYSPLNCFGFSITNELHFTEYKNTTIGNDVWIGAGVFLSEGITISDGAVIGAGSVVTKDVPPYAIVGGVPAKLIKFRFDSEVVAKLQEIRWWEQDFGFLSKNSHFFQRDNNIKNLVDLHEILINSNTKPLADLI